ncbi:pyrroloquinoline quinone biosynthesis peptide chaperone PqqD [Halotalea alkalilenta]|uniref:pyrroloquinoline quinone biosynthesis peptide chaperone PqqD n=1 Tax=Halotalea alkalilenta TaxID=376489 RepID=UPI000489FD79|nr:pyrroloquinoline quinone biosynthesis peptide chaperone PqqD [Halotalea alkalilenta]
MSDLTRTPQLIRGVRMREDPARGGWVLLAPERVFKLDEIGREILSRVDGERSLETIVASLAAAFEAEPERIAADVVAFLDGLAERQVLAFR